jgi:serine/threonine-protein phosphatase PPG1
VNYSVLTFPGVAASVDLDECISRLYKKELLAESVIEAICAKTKELLMRESNVVHVRAPVTVVGDIHGQFFDLIEIFKIGGWCPDTNYLFLGNSLPPPPKPRPPRQPRGVVFIYQ